jgi:hypothetical protein
LSTRQLLALSYRAKQLGDGTGAFALGVSDAAGWLADLLHRMLPDDPAELRVILLARLADGVGWEVSGYGDGMAAVLDDIAGILDNDPATINDIIEYGRDQRRAEKEA